MEIETTASAAPETTTPETQVTETPNPDVTTAAAGEMPVAPVVPDVTPDPAVPIYTPNFGYKVHEVAKEFPESIRSFITTKELENQFRELYEKADGLDHVKPKFERLREEFTQVQQGFQNYESIKQQLGQDVQNGDFDMFFQRMGIPEKMVMQWVADKLRYNELSPDEKRRYDDNIRLKRENANLSRDAGRSSQQASQAEIDKLNFELDTALSSPEVKGIQHEVDSAKGLGWFRNQVVQYAVGVENVTKKKCSPQEAVTGLLALMGRTPGSKPAQVPTPPSQGGVTTQAVKPPVIPNLKSRGGTPVKKKPQSFEELRKQNAERIKEISG